MPVSVVLVDMENQAEHLLVVDTPRPDFERKIALFAQQEADWNTTPFDISLVNGFFIVIYGPRDTLIATGTASFYSTAWFGNVIVAKSQRRKGLASKIVRALEREVKSRMPSMGFSLIASELGQFVYPKLGFQAVEQVFLCRLGPSPPPAATSLRAVVPTEKQHECAIELFKQSSGYSRQQLLQNVFRNTLQCAVLVTKGTVVAAAWARFTSADGNNGKSGVFLGPVVAKSPDYAISVCSEILRMSGEAQSPNSNRGISALVLNRRGDGAELNVFKALGFAAEYQLQHMVKSPGTSERLQSTENVVPLPAEHYFALVGFDSG